jgi:predicted  nucleic acid-binding Zn-ribbon protein
MSTLGKILIGLNLVLAAAFFGWAANATKTNQQWREKHEERTKELSALRTTTDSEIATLKSGKTTAEKDLAVKHGELEAAKNDRSRVQDELKTANDQLSNLRADVTKFASTVESMAADKTRLQADKDKAEKAQRDAETAKNDAEAKRDDAEKAANGLKTELETANNTIADMEKDKTTKEKKIASLETDLETLSVNTGAKAGDYTSMPQIDGAVLDVSNSVEPGLIAINVGANKQVKRGYTFEIFDGKTYKGQARVEFVHPEMCSAIIVTKVPGQTIRQGDRAATRL